MSGPRATDRPPPLPDDAVEAVNDEMERSGEHADGAFEGELQREDSEPSVDLGQAVAHATGLPASTRWLCPRCRSVYGEPHERCPADDFPLVEDMGGAVLAGRYLLRRLIGVGGMGSTVWRAWQISTQRPVAVKLLPAVNDKTAARFAREALIVSNLNHPHITTVHDYGKSEDGKLFLVMELLRGTTLRRLLKQSGPFPLARTLRLADQILGALDFAHRRGVVHRDLKTGNLFLTATVDDRDFAKILDFGIAEFIAGEGGAGAGALRPGGAGTSEIAEMTRPDAELRGTPYYMAPEQLTSVKVDARTDLYALGIVLYALLVGQVPFRAETHSELFREILSRQPPAFADIAPDLEIPGAVETFVMRALAKKPDDRFASARAMREALKEVRHSLGIALEDSDEGLADAAARAVAAAAEPSDDAAVRGAGVGARGVSSEVTEDDAPRPRRLWVFAAVAVVPLLLVAGWLLFRSPASGVDGATPDVPTAGRTETPRRATTPAAAGPGPAAAPTAVAGLTASPDVVAVEEGVAVVAATQEAAAPESDERTDTVDVVSDDTADVAGGAETPDADGGADGAPEVSDEPELTAAPGTTAEPDLTVELGDDPEPEPRRARKRRARRRTPRTEAAPEVVVSPAPDREAAPKAAPKPEPAVAPKTVKVQLLDEEGARDFVVPKDRPTAKPRVEPIDDDKPKVEVLD